MQAIQSVSVNHGLAKRLEDVCQQQYVGSQIEIVIFSENGYVCQTIVKRAL